MTTLDPAFGPMSYRQRLRLAFDMLLPNWARTGYTKWEVKRVTTLEIKRPADRSGTDTDA